MLDSEAEAAARAYLTAGFEPSQAVVSFGCPLGVQTHAFGREILGETTLSRCLHLRMRS